MKSGREHRVPLSKPAIKLLRTMQAGEPGDLVFPGLRGALSDMTLSAVLRRMKVGATVHGFRSSFRDWVSEHTSHSSEVAEMALAHAVGDKVEAAYRRGDLFDKRIALMADWAAFLQAKRPRLRPSGPKR
jgi:integrase